MGNKITEGSIKRNENIQKNKIDKQSKDQYDKKKKISKNVEDQILGIYKKNTINSFIATFASNYGENFNYDSLINSLSFSIKSDSYGGFHPEFKFNVDNVKFNSDIRNECHKFNDNSYENFISNDDAIDGYRLSDLNFNDYDERSAYENTDKYISFNANDNIDGQFISTSNNKDRFGEFNKINKLVGYTPKEESGKLAEKECRKNWSKNQNKILSSVLQNIKI